MTYTTRFGTVTYDSPFGQVEMPDLTKFAAIPDYIKNDPTYYLKYVIKDGERLDQISRRIYDREDRLWVIMLMNDMYNLSERWPLSDQELQMSIAERYPFNSPSDTHHYEDTFENIVDPISGAIYSGMDVELYISTNHLTAVSIIDYETRLNDRKRDIKILDPAYLDRLEASMDAAFADNIPRQ